MDDSQKTWTAKVAKSAKTKKIGSRHTAKDCTLRAG